jgi:RNA-directed DNA polymerase
MRRELHVRFCEGGGVQFLSATRLVVLCRTPEEATAALATVHHWTQAAGLRLHPEKTHLVDMQAPGGFDFLGYHFERHYRLPRKKSRARLKDTIRQKTRRTNGRSLAVIIADVNRTLVGWFGYFKHSHGSFDGLDAWIRTRLRSILRKRAGYRTRRRAWDHWHWPVSFLRHRGCSPWRTPMLPLVGPDMGDFSTGEPDAEIRQSGSEGGGNELNHFSLPLSRGSTRG